MEACRSLIASPDAVLAQVHGLIDEFRRIAGGMLMLGERPPRSVDEAVAIGERLAALLLAAQLESTGTRAQAVSGAGVIVTDAVYGSASPLMDATRGRAAERQHDVKLGAARRPGFDRSTVERDEAVADRHA